MTVIVANTDKNYPVNKNDISVAIGGLADLVEKILGKKFIRFGKPDAQMFLLAYERAMLDTENIKRNEILMVGDTVAAVIPYFICRGFEAAAGEQALQIDFHDALFNRPLSSDNCN